MRYCTLIIFLINAVCLFAGSGSFGAFQGFVTGFGADNTTNIYGNPALVSLEDGDKSVSVTFPYVAFDAVSNSISLDDVNFYFGGVNGKARQLSNSDKDRLLKAFENDGRLFMSLDASYLSFAVKLPSGFGTAGFAMSEHLAGSLNIPSQLVDLALNGNKVGETYSFSNLDFQAWHLRDYKFFYSKNILKSDDNRLKFAMGAAFSLISGFALTKIDKMNATLTTSDKNELTGNFSANITTAFSPIYNVKYDFDNNSYSPGGYSFITTPAGTGFGFDLGGSLVLDSAVTFSFALNNIGSVSWNNHLANHTADAQFKINDLLDKNQLDSLFSIIDTRSSPGKSFSTTLPAVLRLGVSFVSENAFGFIPGKTEGSLTYLQGLNDSPSNSANARFVASASWEPLDWLPYIRLGAASDVTGKYRFALGLGYAYKFFDIYAATGDFFSITGISKTDNASLALCLRIFL